MFLIFCLGLDRSHTSLGFSKNGISLRVSSASAETDTQPHGPSAASEE